MISEQWTWLLCTVSVIPVNKLPLQELNQLIGIKLLTSGFLEIFASSQLPGRVLCPFFPLLRTPVTADNWVWIKLIYPPLRLWCSHQSVHVEPHFSISCLKCFLHFGYQKCFSFINTHTIFLWLKPGRFRTTNLIR